MTHNHGQAGGWRESRERLPVNIFGQHRPEGAFIWLVGEHRH
jgi:hypothetical protein